MLAERTGAKVVELATSVGAFPQIQTYFDLFEFNIDQMVAAYRQYHSETESGDITQ